MIIRLGFAAVAAALLVGCQAAVAPERQWTKKDATPEDIKRDLYWCTRQVSQRRPQDTPVTQRAPVQVVDDECMEKRGYRKTD
jgi:hypothetical protein